MRHCLLTFLLCLLGCSVSLGLQAKSANDPKAKELFSKVHDMVFGPKGSLISYDVNIIGLYKTKGTIIYKGKKRQYSESRYMAWEDGVTAYMVDKEKKEVKIFKADDDSRAKYMSKFKYDLDNFDYSYKTEGDYYLLTAAVRDAGFFGVRWVTVKARRDNLHPVSLQVKLAFLRTTVAITKFRCGDIDDATFVFPREKFSGYTFIDNR